jgi:xanthine/uracil/vitamin C permease (AzgA family)
MDAQHAPALTDFAREPLDTATPAIHRRARVEFNRNELSGAFGDIGTDFPLVVGMILTAGLDPASVLIMFGSMQVFTGLLYGMPMPVQPLKAMAALVITQKLGADVLYGGGLAIGIVMLLLTVTGLIDKLANTIPKVVVRGIQFGLGLQLATIALKEYIPASGVSGYFLAIVASLLTIFLLGNRRFPPAPFVILLGIVSAVFYGANLTSLADGIGFRLPQTQMPALQNIWMGFLLLALPQIPLSLGNSILATRQVVSDLFPQRSITVRRISLTYSLMNIVNPFLSGIPTCHGAGGMVGHFTFGGRTGGSVVLYGSLYLLIGLFFSGSFGEVVHLFPRPVLGVILLFEAVAIMRLVRDVADSKTDFSIVLIGGLIAASLPYGYLISLIVGTFLFYLVRRRLTSLGE